MKKHFVLIELNNDEAPMMGVITNATDPVVDKKSDFVARIGRVITNHFDTKKFLIAGGTPDLWDGSAYWDFNVAIPDYLGMGSDRSFTIRIYEAWLF